jgi:ubiquinone/menaquinone biosynthesis C-methylase UbiE
MPQKFEPQVGSDTYSRSTYCTPQRFAAYAYAIQEVLACQPKTVLEIGIGNGMVTHVLRNAGVDVTTLDIDEMLKPDQVASVTNIPTPPRPYDVVLCCQVLEHLPFNVLAQALSEINKVCGKFLVLSLPDATRYFCIQFHFPGSRICRKLVNLPVPRIKRFEFNGEHYWELGRRGYPLRRIKTMITEAGFTVTRTYRIFEHPYHRIFVAQKT